MRNPRTSLLCLILVPAALTAAACSSSSQETSSGTDVGGAGTGGHAGTGGSASTGGAGGSVPVTCTWTKETSNATCPAGPCPIGLDEALACDDTELAAPGLRVAPAPDATWLATSSSNDREVYRLTASGEEKQDGVPKAYLRTTIALALAPDGTVHLGADTTVPQNTPAGGLVYVGGVVHSTLSASGWTSSKVYGNSNKYAPLVDLEVTDDGVPHLWIVTDAPNAYSMATPGSGSDWTLTDAPVVAPGSGSRFTLGDDGSVVSLAVLEDEASYKNQLHALVNGTDTAVGGTFAGHGLALYAVTAAEAPSAPSGPRYAAAVEADDGIHVVAVPASGAATENVIADAVPPVGSCSTPDNVMACKGTCHDTGKGMEDGAYAIGRTDDGNVWLAYVVTTVDQTIAWSWQGDPGGMFCVGNVAKDSSQGTLHLVRVPSDGSAPAEVLTMPIDRPGGNDAFTDDFYQSVRYVDVRGFGTDLAIGVRTGWTTGQKAVRVLRLDTTKL